ncbi:hypothetical protein TSMEX_009715 [Taenia solium]
MESAVNASLSRSLCDLTLPEFVIYFYVQPSICLAGFLLSVINCQVFRKPVFVGPEYKMMIALSVTDAITLLCTFPLGFQRCKGFLEACLKPWFKSFRLGISYYTAYVQFPVSNASETASIFLTLLLSIERYVAMHKISCPGMWRPKCSIHNLLCYQTKSHHYNMKCHLSSCCSGCRHYFKSIILSLQRLFSLFNDNVLETIIKVIVMSLLINIPMFSDNNNNTITPSNPEESFNVKWRVDVTDFGKSRTYAVYTWLRTVFVHIIPLLLLCIINFYLIKFIRIANARWRGGQKTRKPKKPSSDLTTEVRFNLHTKEDEPITSAATLAANRRNERRQAAQRKLTVLLVAIVGLFLAGQIPQAFAYVSNVQVVLRLFGSHFKHQLGKWIGMCNWRRRRPVQTQTLTVMDSDKYDTTERVNHRLRMKEPVSADGYQVKRRTAPRRVALSSTSHEVPVTDPIAVSDDCDRASFYSYSDHVWRAKEDFSTAPNEKILVRVHSHSKRFWSKRRRLLAETRKRVKFKKTGHLAEQQSSNENRFQLNVTSQRFHGMGHQCRDRSNLQLFLPPYLANVSWCPPFVVASLLRANRSLKDATNPSVRNTIPIAYQETHFDNIL